MIQAPEQILELIAPHPGQLRVISERRRFNAVECGRRWGKTCLGKRLISDTAMDGQPTAWFAPSYKYLLDVWQELNTYLAPVIRRTSQQDRRITLLNGGTLDFWTMEDKDSGRGRKYRRVIIDEAGKMSGLDRIYFEAIRPTLTDLRGDAWLLSTPKGRNFFHQCFTKGQGGDELWKSWRFGTADNPFIDPAEVEAARKELPEAAFNQEYLGIPADDGANPFNLAAIKRCVQPISSRPVEAYGVDLAKSHDWTWIIGLDEHGVVALSERWQSDWQQTEQRLAAILGNTPALVDSTGVGDPIVENLQRKVGAVEGFKFTQQSKQQLMEGLASAIQQSLVGFPDGILVQELESFEFEYTKTGVRYTAPAGLHDDGVCALALACRKLRGGGMLPFTVNVPSAKKPVVAVTHLQDQGWQ